MWVSSELKIRCELTATTLEITLGNDVSFTLFQNNLQGHSVSSTTLLRVLPMSRSHCSGHTREVVAFDTTWAVSSTYNYLGKIMFTNRIEGGNSSQFIHYLLNSNFLHFKVSQITTTSSLSAPSRVERWKTNTRTPKTGWRPTELQHSRWIATHNW